MVLKDVLPILLATAWLLPLASFALIVFFGPRMGKAGRGAGLLATGTIITGFVLSATALVCWISEYPPQQPELHAAAQGDQGHQAAADPGSQGHGLPAEAAAEPHEADAEAAHPPGEAHAQPEPITYYWYSLGEFGSLQVAVSFYIDSLTIAMFCMVTLIASCIHVYSMGYMHEELEDVTDPLVTLSSGRAFTRRGRYYRFFQYLSLFCFSMLGLVIAGNIAMVFVFWELVGICSYLLIGFYIERKSASNAANKAFIVNRVGDFGMIIGLMAVWTGLGTFSFGDYQDQQDVEQPGIFSQVRMAREAAAEHGGLPVPQGMIELPTEAEIEQLALAAETPEKAEENIEAELDRRQRRGYWLLMIAGLGIFCGCVGKSAQFPLHVWLPDAMEGPTPVSALIHAATMVAAGVYLVGRFYPVFTPEVLLVIACVGCITLFMAATIAITATDIKRVLAYSTVSQLGYMMLALGVGGWVAGLFHLFTHAIFKALLFLCSGSVIHACHTNEMPQMGGLLKKMPWTAGTMLVGCLTISGAGIPLIVGLSGYYSKDYILAQALSFQQANPQFGWIFFYAAAIGAAITACYMFRMWYMTFVGPPRDEHVHQHAHESPKLMYVPLVILAFFAVVGGWNLWLPGMDLGIEPLLEQARPAVTAEGASIPAVTYPAEHISHTDHAIHYGATWIAFTAALIGFLFATVFYGVRKLDPEDARRTFAPIHHFLLNKWWFDELYWLVVVRPALLISGWIAAVDKRGIDWLADNSARVVAAVSRLDDWIDRTFVDALIDLIAAGTHAVGLKLRVVQTGNLRQYVMLIAVGTVALFVLISLYWNYAMAG